MRKILTYIFCLLLVAASAQAIVVGFSGPPGSAATFLLEEDFTTGSRPSGWSNVDGSGAEYNYTTNLLEGTYSVYLPSLCYERTPAVTASGTVYIGFSMEWPDGVTVGSIGQRLYDTNGSFSTISILSNRTISINPTGGSTDSTTTEYFSLDTKYYIKCTLTPSTGSNDQTITLSFSTNGTNWTPLLSSNDGTSTYDFSYIQFRGPMLFDEVRVSETDFDY